jgi:hypothetical protein
MKRFVAVLAAVEVCGRGEQALIEEEGLAIAIRRWRRRIVKRSCPSS